MASTHEIGLHVSNRYKELTKKREVWKNIWGLISKYYLQQPMQFADTNNPGLTPRFSVKDVSSDEPGEAATTCSTALAGALWPSAGESFEIVPIKARAASKAIDPFNTPECKAYCVTFTNILRTLIDEPESGFNLAFGEHLTEQPLFATSGIYGIERKDDDVMPFQFRSVSIQSCVIDEAADGTVDTVYLEYNYTIRQLVNKYKLENVSESSRRLYLAGERDEWVKVIQAIEPRLDYKKVPNPTKEETAVASVHYEVNAKHVIENSGFEDGMCVWMVRFLKRANELYGRGPGQTALPTVKALNLVARGMGKAIDKQLDPPMGIFTEMTGGSSVDISAGAKVPLYNTGRIPQGTKPVEPLINVPEPRVANEREMALVERIGRKFYIDRLLDFNNRTRMTAHETELRNDFRNQALGPIFSRQFIELLNPLLKWCIRVLWRRQLVGIPAGSPEIERLQQLGVTPLVIPAVFVEAMNAGVFPFRIRFISPAARAMKQEAMYGIEKLTNMGFAIANAGMPEVWDNYDADEAFRQYQDHCGAPSTLVRTEMDRDNRRRRREAAQAQAAAAAMQEQSASANQKNAKAVKDFTQAGMPAGNLPGFGG